METDQMWVRPSPKDREQINARTDGQHFFYNNVPN